jgi:anti-sigma regulatory factor (Ser/Thr protein kinase)
LQASARWDIEVVFTDNVARLPRQPGPITWEYRLLPHAASVADARWHVRYALESHTDPGTLADIEIVVSELVTNAVRHGPGAVITLRLVTEADGGVSGEVVDQGDGVVAIRGNDFTDAEGGMGLPIVDTLTDAWGVYPGSTHVWFRFERAAAA